MGKITKTNLYNKEKTLDYLVFFFGKKNEKII